MRIAIMQPYLFPYLGYFQLVHAVNKFVFYDDVNFIKGGYVNRNNILANNQEFMFTTPLKKASPNVLISDINIHKELYNSWKEKFLKTLKQEYKKSIHFDRSFDLIKSILSNEEITTISELAIKSVTQIARHLKIETEFKISSKEYSDMEELSRNSRLYVICKLEECDHYINSWGGKELYSKENFNSKGIYLSFIKNNLPEYKQINRKGRFISGLSIIDILMNNDVQVIREMLNAHTLE